MHGRPLITHDAKHSLKLRALLDRLRIEHKAIRLLLVQQFGTRAGLPIAAPTMSSLINDGRWPSTVDRDQAKAAIAQLLRDNGATDADVATAFDHEDGKPTAPRTHRPDAPSADTASDDEPQLPENVMLTDAARKAFGLFRHPFIDDVVESKDVFLSADHRYIRESMFYAAKHGGFLAVVGESGSGKSTLRRDLIDRLGREAEPIVIITPACVDKEVLTAGHICDAIIADLSQQAPKRSLEAKARQVQQILEGSSRAGNSHVLVIEEAHDLNIATLKKLKRFWELEDGFKRLLGIVLIGQPELLKKLDERCNWDAREVIRRIEIAQLPALDANLEEYLDLKFRRVGADPARVFAKDAYDAIRQRLTFRRRGSNEVTSNVYPLTVHNLVVKAMNDAATYGLAQITRQLVLGMNHDA